MKSEFKLTLLPNGKGFAYLRCDDQGRPVDISGIFPRGICLSGCERYVYRRAPTVNIPEKKG